MEKVIDFISIYYREILLVFSVVLETVILIVKRKKSVALTDGQLTQLINWIIEAEKTFGDGHGKEKLDYVLNQFYLYYPQTKVEAWVIKNEVRSILNTPTRKGGLGREED